MKRRFLFLQHVLQETRLSRFETVLTFIIVSSVNDCFVLVACTCNEILLFFGHKGEFGTLVFHKGVNSIRADESSPVVPTRCLNKQNEILLF